MARAARGSRDARAEAQRYIAQNRKARHNYVIEETLEGGLMLMGSEVKGLRSGGSNINEAYIRADNGELWLVNAHIPEYKFAHRDGHEARRPRKVLLHKRQMEKILGAIQREGVTAVPLSLYFNARGIAKVEIGIARGRKQHEKRDMIKQRDWQRDKARIMRERG